MSHGAMLKNPWGDGRDASVSDTDCEFRRCLSVGEDKGTFSAGSGYTSYHKNPKLVCLTRNARGCPTGEPVHKADPEMARCCDRPTFPAARGRPQFQTCTGCKARSGGKRLALAKTLHDLAPLRARRRAFEEAINALCSTCNQPELYAASRRGKEGAWAHGPGLPCPAGEVHELLTKEPRR